MRTWLYDRYNDYTGKIFEGAEEVSRALADGWETAPYPATKKEEKAKTIEVFDKFSQTEPKPERKKPIQRRKSKKTTK
jgi:hypothetical protein